jgi:hypothetical protein
LWGKLASFSLDKRETARHSPGHSFQHPVKDDLIILPSEDLKQPQEKKDGKVVDWMEHVTEQQHRK